MELMMKRTYQPSTPRIPLALLAAAMTALTIGSFVVVPSQTEAVATTCNAPLVAQTATPRSNSL
jgi:hypothetical protein